jgi:hypothetical protein
MPFPRPQRLRERALMLHYTYIISLMFQLTDKNFISSSFEEAIYDEQTLKLHVRISIKRLVPIYIKRQQRNKHIIIIIIIISAIR